MEVLEQLALVCLFICLPFSKIIRRYEGILMKFLGNIDMSQGTDHKILVIPEGLWLLNLQRSKSLLNLLNNLLCYATLQ